MTDNNENKFFKPLNDYSFLTESKYIQKWLENTSESQQRYKLSIMKQFFEFIKKYPDDLILEHHKDLQKEPIKQTEIAKKQLLAFYNFLTGETNDINKKMRKKKPISLNSARQYAYSKLLSFYSHNKVSINFLNNEIPSETVGVIDKVWRNGDGSERIKTIDKKKYLKQIRDSFPNLRDKAILLSKLSSGLDDCDLFNLKIKDFKKGYYSDYNICYLEGDRQKNGERFQNFIGSEACDLINLYLKEREKTKDSEYLFVSYKDMSRKIKDTAFSENLKKICDKLKIKNVTPKTFRRWFNTTLKQSKIDFEIVEVMLGHKIGVSMNYHEILADQETFADFYFENCDPVLSLGNGGGKFKEVDKKVLNLEDQVKALIEEKQQLKKEINKTNEKMTQLEEAFSKQQEMLQKLLSSMK